MTEQELLQAIDPVLLRQVDPNVSEATSPMWVYVAGPMRGIAEFNFPAFEEATKQLRSRGYNVISPAEQDLDGGFDPSGLTGREDLSEIDFDLRAALLSDLDSVSWCDAICLLPGWEFSKGASAELALAEALGLQNGSLEDFLEADGWEPTTEHEFLQGLVRELWPPERLLEAHEEALALFDQATNLAYRPLPTPVEVDMAKAVVDEIGEHLGLVPQEYVDTILQDEKDREARLDRLDHFLTSDAALERLRDRYPMVTIPLAEPPCSNCDDRKCMSCIFREIHDECRDDCPDCCAGGAEPPFSPIVSLAKRYTDRGMVFPGLVTSSEHDNAVRVTSSTGGQKGKKLAQFDLIPPGPWWDVAELYGFGATKYGEPRNWERGHDWSLSYAPMLRHANLFWSREDNDPESGLPHLAAVVFHALSLMEYRTTHPEFDDRPGVSK